MHSVEGKRSVYINSREITSLHHDICNLVRVDQQTDLALAKGLASMAEDTRYRECGAASMADYICHHVNVGDGKAHGLLAIGRKLTALPELAEAMENPESGWTKVRQVARVPEPETVGGWLDAAANFTSRELEVATRGVATGEEAPMPADRPRLQSRTIEFTVTPEMEDVLARSVSFRRAALGDGSEDLSREQVLWMILDQSTVRPVRPVRNRTTTSSTPSANPIDANEYEMLLWRRSATMAPRMGLRTEYTILEKRRESWH